MPEYSEALPVERIANRLINAHHRHLDGATIRYLFRDKAAKSGDKTVWGKARLITGLNAYLAVENEDAEPFFVVEIAEDVWNVLEEAARVALVDHELCHLAVGEDGTLSTAGHDVEDFANVIRRHGLWRPEVEQLVKAALEHGDMPSLFDADTGEIAG